MFITRGISLFPFIRHSESEGNLLMQVVSTQTRCQLLLKDCHRHLGSVYLLLALTSVWLLCYGPFVSIKRGEERGWVVFNIQHFSSCSLIKCFSYWLYMHVEEWIIFKVSVGNLIYMLTEVVMHHNQTLSLKLFELPCTGAKCKNTSQLYGESLQICKLFEPTSPFICVYYLGACPLFPSIKHS